MKKQDTALYYGYKNKSDVAKEHNKSYLEDSIKILLAVTEGWFSESVVIFEQYGKLYIVRTFFDSMDDEKTVHWVPEEITTNTIRYMLKNGNIFGEQLKSQKIKFEKTLENLDKEYSEENGEVLWEGQLVTVKKKDSKYLGEIGQIEWADREENQFHVNLYCKNYEDQSKIFLKEDLEPLPKEYQDN